MNFNCFPVELHHQIICSMEPEDILALRKTSKYFLALTREPRLWTIVHDRMRQTHPLTCSESEFATLMPWQSERVLVRASRTDKVFQTTRESALHRIFPDGQTRKTGPLTVLSFLSERFLLSADDTTVVYVWDLSKLGSSPEAPAFPYVRLTLVTWRFVSYGMSTDLSTLYVVLSKGTRTHIFSLSLPSNTPDLESDEPRLSFRDIAYFDLPFSDIMGIDADSCLVLSEVADMAIEVADWRVEGRSTITLQDAPDTVPNNLVLALRICGPYVLCVRRWSIDAYPIPLCHLKPEHATGQPLPILQHVLQELALSPRISFSRVCHDRSPSGDRNVYTLYALAESNRRKMWYAQIQVHMMPVPSLSVHFVAVDGAHADRRASTWDLGASGLRGAWVLSPNASGDRPVVAFTTSRPASCPSEPHSFPVDDDDAFDVSPDSDSESGCVCAARLNKQVISVVSSKYSDDDVTKCAVSEFTGRIALGSRMGGITVF